MDTFGSKGTLGVREINTPRFGTMFGSIHIVGRKVDVVWENGLRSIRLDGEWQAPDELRARDLRLYVEVDKAAEKSFGHRSQPACLSI